MEDFFGDYDLAHQKCPKCNNSHPVGKLSGGHSPKFYCRSCGHEFKVELKGKRIIATVKFYTVSGVRAGDKRYIYKRKTGCFEPDRFSPRKKSENEA